MLKLEDIRKDAMIAGLEPDQVVRVIYSEMVGDGAVTVFYKKSDGTPVERERSAPGTGPDHDRLQRHQCRRVD